MRTARVATILLFLTASSTAIAATKTIKFGKLVDGTGRVFTNAVVIVMTTASEASLVVMSRYRAARK